MYRDVQWFALLLKIDIFFEVVLLICAAVVTTLIGFRIICIVMATLAAASLIFGRIAVSKESNWMMYVFQFLQLVLFTCFVYSLVGLLKYSNQNLWFTGIVYGTN